MNVFARELLDAAMALPLDERAKLAAELLASMDGKADENVEAVWARELHRRAERAHSGDSVGVDWSTVRIEALRRIRSE